MKKIIIPVDFSQQSEYALETAAALAKKHNSELIVMHMLELSESIFSSSSSDKNEETAFMLLVTNKKFESFLDKPYLEGITVTPMIKNHKVLKEVDEIAKEIDVDLIVMGSRGHNDYDGVLLGSNTEKVVRHSEIPLLVVKSKPETIDFENIVIATDFSADSASAAKVAIKLLSDLSKKITLLHINLPNAHFLSTDEIEEKASKFLKETNLENLKDGIVLISDYNVEEAILGYADKHNMDAIGMITEGRTGLSHLFGGSISEDLVNHSTLPVFTFKK
ncbi:universal stress protein [Psychroserpens ponticola]|uniref:Universal stress protein n=1 Tax=Psychroserpens ponticola TaxID=2932268 RepID=A0ABY7S0H4_9FLAO|nr:universal stress protein [Psychroserpens ponticola]WCO02659.1 universal stress protein [Psychroserpens ponticola]